VKSSLLLTCAGAILTLTSCGYRFSGKSDLLPTTVQTIAVPAFGNITARYQLSSRLPVAIAREFLTRTRYRVVTNEEEADAVLRGAVTNVLAFPVVNDQATGRATGVQIIVYLNLSLIERQSGKVLYSVPNAEYRQIYEISVDQRAYFEESDIALERLSRDVARSVVSAVLEAF
jgi:hypothetical protein